MKREFSFIDIEGKRYPSVIMGEDRFTGWWDRENHSEKERADVYLKSLEEAYLNGVRGFSISPHGTLIRVLKEFKEKHNDIVCISNHHWQNNYYLGDKTLWTEENLHRIAACEKFHSGDLIENADWLKGVDVSKRFSKKEIASFRLDENEYKEQLKMFDFCDFFLVGNLGMSSLINLGREDIVRREVELVREFGGVPIGMCQGGGLSILKYEEMGVAGNWVWLNKFSAYPNLDYALKSIEKSSKPITAYRVFTNPKGFDLKESISFIKTVRKVKSVVVGVENEIQSKENFFELKNYWK